MQDRLSSVRDLRAPAHRLGLRVLAAEQMIQATDQEQAARALFDLIAEGLGLNAFILYVRNAEGRLKLTAHAGLSKEEILTAKAVEASDSKQHRAGNKRYEEIAASLRDLGAMAWFHRPLTNADRLLGIIGFGRRGAEQFDEDELAFLESVARYFALAYERLHKEAALRENLRDSEERLRLGMEAAGFGMFDYDVVHDKLIWSPELKALYEFNTEEEIDAEEAALKIHPDDRQRFLAPFLKARSTGKVEDFSHELRIFQPNGEMRCLSTMARLLFPPGQASQPPERIIGVVQDVTERKLAADRLRDSEERLQLAQELGGVASFDWNIETGEIWISESYRQIFGIDPADNVNIDTFSSLVHPDDRERVINYYSRIEEDTKTSKIEYRIIRPKDLKVCWIYSVIGVFRGPNAEITRLAGITMDITERKRDQERERLLSREIDHRAKNLLSVVQAMVQLTHANSIPEFLDIVKGRIHALGRVHSLLAASRWNGAELSALIGEELAPFEDDGDGNDKDRFTLIGPSVSLKPAAAQSMAVVIHELTTNAAKYGALSVPDGHVEVVWQADNGAEGKLVLHWLESGGPPLEKPGDLGFGLNLIRASIERQLGGTLDIDWRPEGLSCRLSLPSRQIAQEVNA